jgi:Na+-driven multidrug efflux pump
LAAWPTRLIAASIGLDALGRVLGFALRGAGATKIAAGVPFLSQWLVQLPLMGAAAALGYGLTGVAAVQAAITVIDAGVLAWFWSGDRWTKALAGRTTA